MADIRIKDLTTTASSTASDDFIAVDGTTNGTRKLNAFSPTFGGNATVTGTLTVNGTGSSSVATTTPFAVSTGVTVASGGFGVGAVGTGGSFFVNTPSASSGFSSGLAIDGSYPGGIGSQSVINIKAFGVMSGGGYGSTLTFQTTLNGTFNEVMRMTSDKQVSVLGTTASTTTSTGALVVGNGTSGGLGVGGAINSGSYLRSINSAAANDTEFTALRADVGADGTLGAAVVAIGSLPSATGASRYGFITCSDNVDWRKLYIGGRPGLAASGGQVLIPSTASSTTTSSGALVVSGGVGVAGAMNVGGSMKLNYLSTAGDPTALGVVQLYATSNTTSGAGGIEWKADTGGNGYGYRTLTVFDGVSAYDLYTQVRTNSASWTNSLILKSNGNATFSGSVQTSAPTGGTSAAWKLGTVATVSPTSPNRTIEVDIGGTIYYLAAKTTNN